MCYTTDFRTFQSFPKVKKSSTKLQFFSFPSPEIIWGSSDTNYTELKIIYLSVGV